MQRRRAAKCDRRGWPGAKFSRPHGLRKSACKAFAHAGCTAPEIMEVSGHSSLAQVQIYIEEVEQERMAEAAISKLAGVRK